MTNKLLKEKIKSFSFNLKGRRLLQKWQKIADVSSLKNLDQLKVKI